MITTPALTDIREGTLPIRRVITGLDEAGRSTVVEDAVVPHDGSPALTSWITDSVPVDNAAFPDAMPPFERELVHAGGTVFILCRLPAGIHVPLHATDTIDYITMLSGEIVLELETGDVTLTPGTLGIQRGVIHGWRNDGDVDAVYSVVTVPALPVGEGRRG